MSACKIKLMRPPKLIKPYVLRFCRSIVADASPVYVPCLPEPGAPANECFPLIEKKVAAAGGKCVFGWAIWEWPKVLIQAEFHAVLKQADGSFLDIAPKSLPIPRVLFVPDLQRVYRGCQIDNIRQSLCNDKAVNRLCELSTLIFKELNSGQLAAVHGKVIASDQCARYMMEKERVLHTLRRRYGTNYPEHFD